VSINDAGDDGRGDPLEIKSDSTAASEASPRLWAKLLRMAQIFALSSSHILKKSASLVGRRRLQMPQKLLHCALVVL
jgi:hypothetical protein